MNKIYISPDGRDENQGSIESPLASLKAAIMRSRETGIKEIEIMPGNYYGVSVVLTRKDDGLSINASKGNVTLYGGIPIDAWENVDGIFRADIYTTCKKWNVFQDLYRKCVFRVLEVNGELRNRSRLPEKGFYKHLSVWDHQCLSACDGHWDPKPTNHQLYSLKYNKKDLGTWLDTDSAELLVFHEWNASLVGLTGMDDHNGILYFSNPTDHPPGAFAEKNYLANKYIVYNVKEGMTSPGQWYLDKKNGQLWYKPLPGEKPDNIKAVFPTEQSVIALENAHNIHINGVTVALSDSPLINAEYGGRALPGAIRIESSENIILRDVCVRNTTGWGVKISKCSQNIVIENCHFYNMGAGAVNFSDNIHGSNITITRCICHDMGLIYPGAAGIYGSGEYNTIRHCEIHDTTYCAINDIGNRSLIENNMIWNIKQQMQDGGAIYLVFAEEVILRGNVVLNNRNSMTQAMSYYFDELCTNCIAENNLSVNAIVPGQNHIAKSCTYKNNIFLENGLMKIRYPLCYDLHFIGNILMADEIIFFGPSSHVHYPLPENLTEAARKCISKYLDADGITVFRDNVVLSRNKPPVIQVEFNPGEPEIYMPENNLYGPPGFSDLDNGNFTVRPGSLAEQVKFPALSFKNVGCTGQFEKLFKKFWPQEPNYIYGWSAEKRTLEESEESEES